MLIDILVMAGCVAIGFGLGRVKNAKKLAAVTAELNTVEAKAITDAKAVIAAVRARL